MAPPRSVVESFQVTLDLFETGVAMMRQNLRRANPGAGDHEIDRLLQAWLIDRPGARDGDAEGTPVDWSARQ